MALIVEDGSGVINANSYGSIVDAKAYAVDRGIDLGTDNSKITAWLIQGTDYLESFNYVGLENVFGQALSWPRKFVRFDIDTVFPTNQIPTNLVKALFELVIVQFNGLVLSPVSDGSPFVTEEKVDVLLEKFSERISTTGQPILPKILSLLRGMIIATPILKTVRL